MAIEIAPQHAAADGSVLLNPNLGEHGRHTLSITNSGLSSGRFHPVDVYAVMQHIKVDAGSFYLEWLLSSDYAALVETIDGKVTAFPRLSSLQTKFDDDMRLSEVKASIHSKIDSSRQGISIFGMNIAYDLIQLALPGVLMVLFCGLLSGMHHVVRLQATITDQDNLLAATFPWIALFPGRYNEILFVVSIASVPVSVFLYLISTFDLSSLMSFFLILSTSVLAWCAYEAYGLHHRLQDQAIRARRSRGSSIV